MNRQNRKVIVTALCALLSATPAWAQSSDSHGGEFTSADFAKRARHWVEVMEQNSLQVVGEVRLSQLRELVVGSETKMPMRVFGCKEQAYLNTVDPCKRGTHEVYAIPRDGVNIPDRREVYLTLPVWKEAAADEAKLDRMEAHEICGLLKLEFDGDYTKSQKFLLDLGPYLEADRQSRAKELFLKEKPENRLWPLTESLRQHYAASKGAELKAVLLEILLKFEFSRLLDVVDRNALKTIQASLPGALRSTDLAPEIIASSAETLPDLIVEVALKKIEGVTPEIARLWTSRLAWQENLGELTRMQLAESAIRSSLAGIAQAADPSDNPYAEYIGEKFSMRSRVAEPQDLQAGKVWYCNSFVMANELDIGDRISADKGRVISKALPWYRFAENNQGFYRNTGLSKIPALVRLEQYQALSGTSDRQIVDYVRVTPNGSLVGETSVSASSPLYALSTTTSSVNPRRKVVAYHQCLKSEVKSSSPTLNALDVLSTKGVDQFHKYLTNRTVGLCHYRVEHTTTTERVRGTWWKEGYRFSDPTYAKIFWGEFDKITYEILISGMTYSWQYFAESHLMRTWRMYYINGYATLPASAYHYDDLRTDEQKIVASGLSDPAKRNVGMLYQLLTSGVCEIDVNDRQPLINIEEKPYDRNEDARKKRLQRQMQRELDDRYDDEIISPLSDEDY